MIRSHCFCPLNSVCQHKQQNQTFAKLAAKHERTDLIVLFTAVIRSNYLTIEIYTIFFQIINAKLR